MTLNYYSGRYEIGTKVVISGQRHAKGGEEGKIVGPATGDPHRFRVRIGREVYVVSGKNLKEVGENRK